jgi:LmbE family N-acetylglucosaminyl deacetylase
MSISTPEGISAQRAPGTVVLLHAHPDDEAIFTGITMRRLADDGHRVVLVTATAGEVGEPRFALPTGQSLAERRTRELESACELLGVDRLVLLDHRDSGMSGTEHNAHPQAFTNVGIATAARALADLLEFEGADTLVHYDSDGIYGHPDHVAVHRVGDAAAVLAGATSYQATVDREHLHFTEKHLVADDEAPRSRHDLGRVSAEISLAVKGRRHELDAKAGAMLAHSSQIGESSVLFDGFADSYGFEWYLRTHGPATLEHLGNEHLTAIPGRTTRH